MTRIKNYSLAQLLAELRFTPAGKRRRQLESAEKLLAIVEPDKQYPFEFVFYRITSFRLKSSAGGELIRGSELVEDLRIFIEKLSGQLCLSAVKQGQKVYTVEQMARRFGVCTKTIARWRRRGLPARKFAFEDAKKKIGFLQSAVDEFIAASPDAAARAGQFTRLTDNQKQRIIKQAKDLAAKTRLSRHRIIGRLAARWHRVHETIRYIIRDYERANPEKKVFQKPCGVMSPAQAAELYRLHQQGWVLKELMARFNRSKSSIYRIINQRRARALLAKRIEFIPSEEFLQPTAQEKILQAGTGEPAPSSQAKGQAVRRIDDRLSLYRDNRGAVPSLTRQQEMELFRKYNYLKYLACISRAGIKPSAGCAGRIRQVEGYLAEAEKIKNILVEANLQLVVAIARRHAAGEAAMAELISEGSVSLMEAVEKFDYARGFRFATYASWIIARDYARKIPAETARPDKAAAVAVGDVVHDLRAAKTVSTVAVERARRSLVQVIRENLDEREQYVIINHFGLEGTLVRKEKKTLKEIGTELRLTKERIRQIELEALQKLRQMLSIEQFELLTG